MEVTEFDIDGFIGEWGYNNRYVKSYLNAAGKTPVVCRVCSGGGDFLMAMNIKDEFARHGDVTVDISGYAASAATIIGLGAKHTRISNTSFYLIHKVMSWVEAWGNLNEDDISDLIETLEAEKNENAKMTLVLAKAYADKSGKAVSEILALMKQETWLSADEAKEWGFVDEVYNSTAKLNIAGISKKFNMMGLPKLPGVDGTEENGTESLVNKVVSGVCQVLEKFNLNLNKERKMKEFKKINGVLKVETLESADGKGVYLNEKQLQEIEDSFTAGEQRIVALQGHETNYNSAVEKLDALHPDVKVAADLAAKLNVLAAKLAEKPGVPASGVQGSGNAGGENDGVNWEVMNSLGHMNPKPGEFI